jgi:hypothetical protein
VTIAELMILLREFDEETEIFIGYVDGHTIVQEDFWVVETFARDDYKTVSLMVDDINIINN